MRIVCNICFSLLPLVVIIAMIQLFYEQIDNNLGYGMLPVSIVLFLCCSFLPLIIAAVIRSLKKAKGSLKHPLHPIGIVTPIGYCLFIFILVFAAEYVASNIPWVCRATTSKKMRTWPFPLEVLSVFDGRGNSRNVRFIDGWIDIDVGNPTLHFELEDMTCYSRDGSGDMPLTLETLSNYYANTSLSSHDPRDSLTEKEVDELAEETYQSILKIKSIRSESQLDSTYDRIGVDAEEWAFFWTGGIMSLILMCPASYFLTRKYLSTSKVPEAS